MALKGNGKRVRYVTLPHEAHRYAARETLLHVAAEGLKWFDQYLKKEHGTPTLTVRREDERQVVERGVQSRDSC